MKVLESARKVLRVCVCDWMNETYTRRPIYVPAYHLYHDRVDLVKTLPQPSLNEHTGPKKEICLG